MPAAEEDGPAPLAVPAQRTASASQVRISISIWWCGESILLTFTWHTPYPLQFPLNYRYPVRLFADVLRLVTRSQRFDFSGGRRCRPDSPGNPGQRGELQSSRLPLGETCLQLPAANYGQPGRRSGLDAGRFLESLPEPPQARRSRTLRPLAVPHRAQRA